MPEPGRFESLLDEFKRRRVFRTAALYLAAAFVGLQVADLLFQAEFFPDWAYSAVVLVAALGFPVALALSWAFDWTPEGVRRSDAYTTRPVQSRPAGRLARWSLVLVVVLATGGAGLFAWETLIRDPVLTAEAGAVPGGRGGAVGGAEPALDPLRVAVLYLDNETREDSLAYLARGLTDGLITALGRVERIHVASRNAVRAAAEGQVDVDGLMVELGAGTYVDGTLSRSGGELRVDLQLVDARTGFALSTHSVARPASAPLALRDTLVVALSEALRRRLGVEVRARTLQASGVTEQAWVSMHRADRILEGRDDLWDTGPEEFQAGMDRADSLLAVAESGAPQWTEPVLRRGWLEYMRSRYVTAMPGGVVSAPLERGLEHAERALALAPDDAAAARELRGALRRSLAVTLDERDDRDRLLRLASEDLSRAVEERPSLARAWWHLSEVHRLQGDFPASMEAAERALREDAFLEEAADVYRQLFHTAFEQEEHDRAARWCAEGRRRFPHRGDMILCRLLILATVDSIPPDPGAVAAVADTLVGSVSPPDSGAWRSYATMQLAKVQARAGLADSAEAAIRRAHGDGFQDWLAYDEAHVRLLLGQSDSALALLRSVLEQQPDRAEYWVRDWWLRELWLDPRFREMVGRPGER
jgi:TolB-like protein/tetratricopeptide (TPR) repeat protein